MLSFSSGRSDHRLRDGQKWLKEDKGEGTQHRGGDGKTTIVNGRSPNNSFSALQDSVWSKNKGGPPSPSRGGTLGISGWGCTAGTLESLTYTRASSAEVCYPILK